MYRWWFGDWFFDVFARSKEKTKIFVAVVDAFFLGTFYEFFLFQINKPILIPPALDTQQCLKWFAESGALPDEFTDDEESENIPVPPSRKQPAAAAAAVAAPVSAATSSKVQHGVKTFEVRHHDALNATGSNAVLCVCIFKCDTVPCDLYRLHFLLFFWTDWQAFKWSRRWWISWLLMTEVNAYQAGTNTGASWVRWLN